MIEIDPTYDRTTITVLIQQRSLDDIVGGHHGKNDQLGISIMNQLLIKTAENRKRKAIL